mmetsp:Transcript_51774/g.150327  ORF Transcript_51774/g.150327 Transcript_51774/m.150327 type:complete len:88 (+) Transcript_51774:650-913(+)
MRDPKLAAFLFMPVSANEVSADLGLRIPQCGLRSPFKAACSGGLSQGALQSTAAEGTLVFRMFGFYSVGLLYDVRGRLPFLRIIVNA